MVKLANIAETHLRRFRTLQRLSTADCRLLIKVTLLLVTIRVAVKILPFGAWRRLLARIGEPANQKFEPDPLRQSRIVWAVSSVSRRNIAGKPSCLVQALAVQLFLKRRGEATALEIGVSKDSHGQLHAHAWVEKAGQILIGGTELDRYRRLAAVDLLQS